MSKETTSQKLKAAMDLFIAKQPGAKGKFRAYMSEHDPHEVEIFNEVGLDSIVSLKYGTVRCFF